MSENLKLNTTWNLSDLYTSIHDKNILTDLERVKKSVSAFSKKWRNRKDYLENIDVLVESLDEYEEIMRNYGVGGKASYYAELNLSLDQNNNEVKALYSQVTEVSRKIENEILFYTLNLSKIPKEKQEELMNSKKIEKYKNFLKMLFARSRYTLNESEEKILNLIYQTSYENWVNMTSSFIAKEEIAVLTEKGKQKLSFSSIMGLLENTEKEIRDSAASAINKILKKHVDSGEHEINSVLAFRKTLDELKGFERPDSARLLNDNIDSNTVDVLIKAVSSKYTISRKYYELKAKLLGVKKIKYHERNVTYGSTEKSYDYALGFKIVKEVLSNLDEKFGEILQQYNDEGRIDVYPKKGKKNGAFCAHNLICQPTYILLNYNNKLSDVLTLAHEVGHGINNEFIKNSQHSLYFATPVSTAEVASTFMEDFVLQRLMNDADEEKRLALMMMKLNDDISTIFRQIACYQFELDLHDAYRKEGYLSKKRIGEIFLKNMKAYTGDFVSYDKDSMNWWLYWSHIRYYFYVYSYASGLLISKSLQNMVKNNPNDIEKVKKFLSAGTSKSPYDIFLEMGINIDDNSFWFQGLEEVENLLNETEKLAVKLGRI